MFEESFFSQDFQAPEPTKQAKVSDTYQCIDSLFNFDDDKESLSTPA